MAAARVAHVADWKREVVDELAQQLLSTRVIGIVNISELPAKQFQEIRESLRGEATIRVVKNTLFLLALKKAAEQRRELEKLLDYVRGPTAVIFSELDAFKLSKFLREHRTKAPAKPGSHAPRDIVIPAGETDLPPGPVVGELQRAGIKARIQAGKVVILEDCVLVKAGDTINAEISDILAKFNILPLELGLSLGAAFQDGMVFTADLLEIDEQVVSGQLQQAVAWAFNLAINIRYPTKRTVELFIAEAGSAARNLALNARYPVGEIMPELLALGHHEMLALASTVGQRNEAGLDEELKQLVVRDQRPAPGEGKEEKPPEEKPKEEEKEEKGEELSGLGALFG